MELANPEYALSALIQRHGKPADTRSERNYKKQARQIRVSLLQAQEYFDAAYAASAATSPSHLYYGMVSLASAVMLLRGDGTKSLDVLRRDPKNLHHGLRFSTAATESSAKSGLVILSDTRVEVAPYGHFANWYTTLPRDWPVYGVETIIRAGSDTGKTNRVQLGMDRIPDIRSLIGTSQNLLALLQMMPDLRAMLVRYNASIPSSRVSFESQVLQAQTPGHPSQVTLTWRIHDARTRDALFSLLERFTARPGDESAFRWQMDESETRCIVTNRLVEGSDFTFPSIREDMNLNAFAYGNKSSQSEFVDAYLVAYGLSMLARYNPDIWIASLESHCSATKVIDRFVDVMMTRAPILAARLLSDMDLIISVHNPSWYD
jgi:hypothetical protein